MLHRQKTSHQWLRHLSTLFVVVAAGLAVVAAPASAAPTSAAPGNSYAFVLFDGGGVVPSGTWPATTTVVSAGPGQYTIVFPGRAAPGGVVHVTAIDPGPVSCEPQTWAPSGLDEIVQVGCWAAGSTAPVPSRFSAVFTSVSGLTPVAGPRYAYVDALPNGLIISQYNSMGVSNVVQPLGVGQWVVALPQLGTPTPMDGTIQVNAVESGTPARCKVAQWNSTQNAQQILVHCYDANGAPADSRFTLIYQYYRSIAGTASPSSGYVWDQPPVGPPTTNYNSVLGLGANSVGQIDPFHFQVVFPDLVLLPDDIQVTAIGMGPEFCGMDNVWLHQPNATVVNSVRCFMPTGQMVPAGFFVDDNSQY